MKCNFTLILLFLFGTIYSQNHIAKQIQDLERNQVQFVPVSVFNNSGTTTDKNIVKTVNNATLANLDSNKLETFFIQKQQFITLQIPYNNQILNVKLFQYEIFANGFHVDTDKIQNNNYEKGVYYLGIINNDYTSVASFSFFRNEFSGVISASNFGNIVVGKLDKKNNSTDYIIYSDQDFKVAPDVNCSFKDDDVPIIKNQEVNKTNASARCVTMYFEMDYALYQANNSNITTTTNWMTAVFNNLQTLYANDGITCSLKSVFIWTTPDPYSGTTSTDYLFQFNNFRPVFDGDMGQLIGIDPGGLGGVAVGINGVCSSQNFCYSDVSFSYNTVPTYSFTIFVIAHEFGHLLGSRHTHACAWNGNNTPIDGCGQQSGNAEGNCAQGPIPSNTVKGTIMSYCHLISGVGINFNNGFGPQPTATILNRINNGICLSTDCINTCINTVSRIDIASETTTSMNLSWLDASSTTSWKVRFYPFNGAIGNTITVNSPNFSATGLLPNTYYVIEVSPNCSNGLVSPTRKRILLTQTNYCTNTTLVDTGGITGNYENEQDIVRVLIPQNPNQAINVTFSAFSLEVDYDYVYIHNGNSTTAPLLNPGGSTGNTIPGPFVSTATDGSLTMRFFSDQGVVDSGYVATTSCTTNLGVADNSVVDFSYYPNPTNGIVNLTANGTISGVSVYNITGQLLYESKSNLNSVDISAFAKGTYFFKLTINDRQVHFKILKK
jgi:hypothetical protein